MLKLELTDGHRKVIAMEYRPIPVLNTKLPPGYKLKITGPLKVINKVLLLEPKNVKLLGGEVDTLLIPNALENLLLKTLGEPLVDNPKMDYAEDKVQEDRSRSSPNLGITPMTMSKPPEPVFQPSISSNSIINNFVMDDEDDLLLGSINLDIQCENNIVPVSEPTTASTFAFENDEDDMEMLLAMENIDNNHPNPMDVDENFIAEQLVEAPRSSSTFSSNNSRPPNTSTAQSLPQTPSSNSFTDINYGFKIKGNNLLTIDQLSTLDNFAITRDFVLYSAIDGPCDKFKIVNKKWFFSVFLKDAYSQELYKVNDSV